MVGRVVASNPVMQSVTVVPPEGAIIVPQFGKARFGAQSYDAAQVDAWVSETVTKVTNLSTEVNRLRMQLSNQGVQATTMRQSSEGVVASKDMEISRKNDEIKDLNSKIADLKADLAKEKSRNSLTGVADELDALRNKTQALCDKRIADTTTEAQGIKADADEYSQAKRSSADEYSANTKSEADAYSKDTRADADNYAEMVKATADDRAQGIIDDASKRGAEMIKATKRNIQELRNKSFGVIEKASKVGIDKLIVAEDARSSVAKLLADLSAQVASFSNTDSDVLKELKGNTIESLSAEFDSRVLDMTSDAQTVDDVLVDSKTVKEPTAIEEPKTTEEPKTLEESVSTVEPPTLSVQKVGTTQVEEERDPGISSEETIVLPALTDVTGTQEELPVVTSKMSSIGLEAVADLK